MKQITKILFRLLVIIMILLFAAFIVIDTVTIIPIWILGLKPYYMTEKISDIIQFIVDTKI